MMQSSATISGISHVFPQAIESNLELLHEHPDWDIERIVGKTGIISRHIASSEETALTLARSAAEKVLDEQAVDPGDIDYLLYCTQSPDYILPSGACLLQDQLGIPKHVGAFDFNLGCSGYVYGLQLSNALLQNHTASKVLLVTSDTYTKFVNSGDRTSRTLFGDGAAATLLERGSSSSGLGSFVVGTDGSGAESLIVPAGGLRNPATSETAEESTDESGTRSKNDLFMNGKAVFSFAISTVPAAVRALLKKSNLSIDDVDCFVFHQANKYMLQQLGKRLKVPDEKLLIDVESVGNTVSSSIPIAINRGINRGELRQGHRLVLVGFGVGFSWAVCDLVL